MLVCRCTQVINLFMNFLLFRVVEIQRIVEATATPVREGANLSDE